MNREKVQNVIDYFAKDEAELKTYPEFLKDVSWEFSEFHKNNTISFKRMYIEEYIERKEKKKVVYFSLNLKKKKNE